MSDLGMSTTSDVTKCKECGVLTSQDNTINKTADEQTFKTQKDAQPNQHTSDLGTCCCCEYYGIPCRQISTNESETTKQKNRILFSGINRQMSPPKQLMNRHKRMHTNRQMILERVVVSTMEFLVARSIQTKVKLQNRRIGFYFLA